MVDKIKGFFEENSVKSMMRLCTFLLVCSGIIVTSVAVFAGLDGGYYGIELATLGLIGKGYQKTVENNKDKP